MVLPPLPPCQFRRTNDGERRGYFNEVSAFLVYNCGALGGTDEERRKIVHKDVPLELCEHALVFARLGQHKFPVAALRASDEKPAQRVRQENAP